MMTPKRLLRLPQATQRIEELADGRFQPVLAEPASTPQQVTRLLLCSGKIYYDLVGHAVAKARRQVADRPGRAAVPVPAGRDPLAGRELPEAEEVVWVQEEPRNMGARAHMSPRLLQILPEHLEFGYVGRPERAASGEGYPVAHATEQNRIVTTALDLGQPVSQYPRKLPGER